MTQVKSNFKVLIKNNPNFSREDIVHVNRSGYLVKNDLFWTPGLPVGVLCNHPCPWSVRGPSVGPSLNISETALRIFLISCMKLVHHKGTKVTEPDF